MSSTKSAATMIGCFLAGAASVAAFSWMGNSIRGKRKTQATLDQTKTSLSSQSSVLPPELREEQLSRHTLYFGKDGMDSIQASNICIVGLGGVGSHAAIMLARGGVQKYLRLIDFDQVTLSSLNRHACATLKDVGIPKVICVQKICNDLGVLNVDALVAMYTEESGHALLELPKDDNGNTQRWDVVIDCIDDVPTKAALLTYCILNNIRVLSCMGAGGKSDMTRLHISDLRTASRDPLASKLRQRMKRTMEKAKMEANGARKTDVEPTTDDPVNSYLEDMGKLSIIYTSEKTVMKLAELTDEQKNQKDKTQFGTVDNFRIRILPVLGPLPAIMGQSLAAIALCELGKKPIQRPVTGERVGKNVRHKIYQHLMTREQKIRIGELQVADGASFVGPLEIDEDDVEYLLGVWMNRCGVTGARLGTTLSLIRWDTSKPATVDNLVLMSSHAVNAYDEKGRQSVEVAIQRRIEGRLEGCRHLNADF
jgi:tRNA threonylcarbamoyladenosine dehydratase